MITKGGFLTMGTKRIGLARIEALMENLKRELAMAGATLKGTRRPVVALTDAAGAGAIRSAITVAESGTIFTVPELTSGTQTITLPALAAGVVGCTYTFVMLDTADQDFNVLGASSDKILAVAPKGDGDNTGISAGKDSIGFDANAVLGSAFSVTCISSTAATGWLAHDVIDGLAANTGGINLA
jgi:hypothetical protein